ncbi:MAG: TIR domain-containing protein [Dehalococcoidales bacterium]
MDALNDMKDFYTKILKYDVMVREYINAFYADDSFISNMKNLREELQRDSSRLENVILKYSSMNDIKVFDVAFSRVSTFNCTDQLNALDKIKPVINKVVGKLEAEGATWNIPIEKINGKPQHTKAFISHSGKTSALTDLRDFLNDLEIDPLIAITKPNLDRETNVKVENYLDEANFVIILATGDARDRNNVAIPAGNVSHEIGLAQARLRLKGKIIYLLEKGVEFPSNIKPKAYVRFDRNNIQNVFGDIIKEIKGMGFSI